MKTGNGSIGCLLVTSFFIAAGAFLAADLLHLWPALYQAAQSPLAWPVVIAGLVLWLVLLAIKPAMR